MDDFGVDVLQAIFEKYIIAKTGLEPEKDVVKVAWERLRESQRIRAVK